VEPSDTFELVSQPSWPLELASGETALIIVGIMETRPATYHGTLTVKAAGCRDTDLQIPIEGEGDVSRRPPSCGGPAGGASVLALALLALWRRCRKSVRA